MSWAQQIIEGILPTSRLDLFHARLVRPGAPRVLVLGGSNYDLSLKRSLWDSPIADRFDIATYEPRGVGRTERPDGVWTMQDYAKDALAFMDALGWMDAVVLGESFGGMTALHLALMAPERLRALVVASATAGGDTHASYEIAEFLALNREDAAREALRLQDSRLIDLERSSPADFNVRLAARIRFEQQFYDTSIANGGYPRLLKARSLHDCAAELGRIKTRTTVIAGRHDRQAHPDAQMALAKALPNSQFFEFDGGHGLLFTQTDAGLCAQKAVLAAWASEDLRHSVS